MGIGKTLYVTSRAEFRKWLAKNHGSRREIWLVQYKKATGKPSINYVDAVEEAISFGWIDGLEKGMDAERYATHFTPRRPRSNWTGTNRQPARKMIADGRMTEAGLGSLPADLRIDASEVTYTGRERMWLLTTICIFAEHHLAASRRLWDSADRTANSNCSETTIARVAPSPRDNSILLHYGVALPRAPEA